MLNQIEPVLDIVVLTKYKDNYLWFISEREFWYLDYRKYSHEFDPTDNDFKDRFDVAVLDEHSFEDFLLRTEEFKFEVTVLKDDFKKLLPLTDWDSSFHLFPALFVDFDQKKLFSVYQESISFENYIPTSNWIGVYEDFYKLIPEEEKYWILDGVDNYDILLTR